MSKSLISPVFIISLLIGFTLSFYPLRGTATFWRPLCVFLVVIYWLMSEPHRLGVAFAWTMGLLQDILTIGTTMGQYALALAICAYLLQQAGQRLHHFTVWHKVFVVVILATFHQLVVIVVNLIAEKPADNWQMLYPVITTAPLWPVVAGVLYWLDKPRQ